MDLMHGTLESLCKSHGSPSQVLGHHVLHQMLQALDYLSSLRYVHRDVKPDNIFYTISPSSPYCYHFRLGDFGLCESEDDMVDTHGSMMYLAPETSLGEPQSHKSDIWALYVTMLWTLNVEGIRGVVESQGPIYGAGYACIIAFSAARDPRTAMLGGMARIDRAERATAGDVLRDFFP
jgi:serine/threonine protein kinase